MNEGIPSARIRTAKRRLFAVDGGKTGSKRVAVTIGSLARATFTVLALLLAATLGHNQSAGLMAFEGLPKGTSLVRSLRESYAASATFPSDISTALLMKLPRFASWGLDPRGAEGASSEAATRGAPVNPPARSPSPKSHAPEGARTPTGPPAKRAFRWLGGNPYLSLLGIPRGK